MLYKHKWSPVLRCALHVIRNDVEKVTLDIGGSPESVFTSQTPFTKKRVTTQRVYGKTTMPDDFELGGEDEMKPTSSVTFSTSLPIT